MVRVCASNSGKSIFESLKRFFAAGSHRTSRSVKLAIEPLEDRRLFAAFTNITAASGVAAIVAQKYQETPNWWLSGQHLVDLDNDGDLDLYLSNHGGGSVAALNNGSGVFARVTTGSIPDSEIHQVYDINEDGRIDVSMTYQDGGGRWWLNNSTPGMVNFTATNITRGGNTARSQVMTDFNGDGNVDWLRSAPPGLVVDFGNGAGSFTTGSLSFTVPGTTSNENASFLPADYDDDGDIDLLVVNGGGYDGTLGKTSYWRNNSNLTFTDVTAGAGIPANGTIARGIGDFDQDGDTDFIAIENKSMPPAIFMNNGQGVFTKKSGAVSGVASGTMEYSAWGTTISTDFDNDGIVDIIMNGKYYLKVLRGTGGGNFTYMNNAWGIRDTAASAVDDGLCFGDIDGDGDLDIIGYNETWPMRTLNIYRNDLAAQNWFNVRPVGLAGNKGATGAKISIYAAGTNQLLWYEQVATYDFQVATSYYGHQETERHFGLGMRATVDVVVEFAGSGNVTRINNVAANQTIRVIESQITPPALTGDYNKNGKVDAADYVVWRHMQGANVPQFSGSDGDGDGNVDSEDYNVWRARFGMTTPASSTADVINVPASGPASTPIGPTSNPLSSEKIASPKAANAAVARAAKFAEFDQDLMLLAVDRVKRSARNDAATTEFDSRVDFANVHWDGEGLDVSSLRSLIQAAACPWSPDRAR
jgi:ASPIC/UnbV protein/VCBS repeat protein